MMTYFEEKGIELQKLSRSPREADRRYERSCEICCITGKRICCDRCGIDYVHKQVIEAFSVLGFKSAEQSYLRVS